MIIIVFPKIRIFNSTGIDPLHVRGNAANQEDRTIIFFLHENISQFPEAKICFVLSSRLAAFPLCARGL